MFTNRTQYHLGPLQEHITLVTTKFFLNVHVKRVTRQSPANVGKLCFHVIPGATTAWPVQTNNIHETCVKFIISFCNKHILIMYCSILTSYALYLCVFLKVLFSALYVCQGCLLCSFVNDVLYKVSRFFYHIFKIDLHIKYIVHSVGQL